MKFVEVDIEKVPRMGYKRNELKARLDEFMGMRVKAVEVKWQGTYKSANVAAKCIYASAKNWALPIDVARRGDTVYMIRRDI